MHFHVIIPDIRSSGEPGTFYPQIINDFPAVWNYGKLSAKFLVSSVKDIGTVGFCRFFKFYSNNIKIPLKFPAFTFNKPKGWSISASNTEDNSAAFIMKGGGERSLKFCNILGGITNILLIQQVITKNLQNLKNFQRQKMTLPLNNLRKK